MFAQMNDMRKFSTYTMLKVTQFSEVSLESLDGIPVSVKKYHPHVDAKRYEMERDILIELNGKFRAPRLLACDDETKTLYIEWIAGDRLKEWMIQRYLGLQDLDSYHRTETIKRAYELFKDDQSPETMNVKTQVFSIVRLLHRYGIMHGDLDPRNFTITPDGLVKVFDFSNGQFAQPGSRSFVTDLSCLEQKWDIRWSSFEQRIASYPAAHYYQSCVYPDGFISSGDGQGSTYRKFNYLAVKNLEGYSFLDIGCAEGEVCRYAYRKGANRVLGIDIDDNALSRGRGINRLYGYRSVTLTKGDVRNLMESTGGEKYDVVTCFAVLHHLLPGKRYRDILAVVTKPEWTGVRALLINLINGILSVTNQVLFLELPFEFLGVSDGTLETGQRFCENVAPDLHGPVQSLGIWHANLKKARFIFRIDGPEFSPAIAGKILLSDPILDAWHRNLPLIRPTSRVPPSPSSEWTGLVTRAYQWARSVINRI